MQTPPLKFTTLIPETWKRLEKLPRTGWVMWNVPNPETVAEHTIALRELACELKVKLLLSESDFDRLLDMLEIHDWAESITGDIVVERYPKTKQSQIISQKGQDELHAMQQICTPLGETGLYIIELFLEMETQSTPLSHIAYHIDKIQADIKAVEYELRYGIKGLAWEFLQYDKNKYSIPLFKHMHHTLLASPDIHKEFIL